MKNISYEELEDYGIVINCDEMDNGEKRFRLIGKDGSTNTRTESSENSGWQNSHYHIKVKELYLVQQGKIILAQLVNNRIYLKEYVEGEYFVVEAKVSHNIYLYPNTIMQTIKFGDCSEADWYSDIRLDELLKKVNIEDFEEDNNEESV